MPKDKVRFKEGETIPAPSNITPLDRESNIPIQTPLNYDYLGRYGVGTTKYDYQIFPTNVSNLGNIRADRQGKLAELGAAGANLASQTVIGTIKSIPDMYDVGKAFFGTEGLSRIGDPDFINPISKFLGDIQEDINVPVYRHTNGFHPSEWFASNVPSVGSAVTFLIPGIAIAKGTGLFTKLFVKGASKLGKIAGLTEEGFQIGKQSMAMIESSFSAIGMNAQEIITQAIPVMQEQRKRLEESGKFTKEQIDAKIGTLAWDNYIRNLPGIIADFPISYHMLKPSSFVLESAEKGLGTSILPTNALKGLETFKPVRLYGTLLKEDVGEMGQEMLQNINTNKDIRDVDIMLGLSKTPYTIAEGLSDPDTWNAGVWGFIGGATMTGGGSVYRQGMENIQARNDYDTQRAKFESDEAYKKFATENGYDLQKRGWLSGVGKAMWTGMTINEEKVVKKKYEALRDINDKIVRLTTFKDIADLGKNEKLYNDVNNMLTSEFALGSMIKNSYPQAEQMLEKITQHVNDVIASPEFEQVAPDIQKQYKAIQDNAKEAKKVFEDTKKHFVKAVNIYGIENPGTQMEYVHNAMDIQRIDNRIKDVTGKASFMYAQDEFGITKRKNNKKFVEYKEKLDEVNKRIEEINNNLSDETLKDEARNKEEAKLSQALNEAKDLEKKSRSNFKNEKLTVAEIEEMEIARLSIDRKLLKDRMKDIVSGKYEENEIKKVKEIIADPVYGEFLYGNKNLGIFEELSMTNTKSKIGDVINIAGNDYAKKGLRDENSDLSDTMQKIEDNEVILDNENRASLRNRLNKEKTLTRQDRNGLIDGFFARTSVFNTETQEEITGINKNELDEAIKNNRLDDYLSETIGNPEVEQQLKTIINSQEARLLLLEEQYNRINELKGEVYNLKDEDDVLRYTIEKKLGLIRDRIKSIKSSEALSLDEIVSSVNLLNSMAKMVKDERFTNKYSKDILNTIRDEVAVLKEESDAIVKDIKQKLDDSDKMQQSKHDKWISDLSNIIGNVVPGFKSNDIVEVFKKIEELKDNKSLTNKIDKSIQSISIDFNNSVAKYITENARREINTIDYIKENPESAMYLWAYYEMMILPARTKEGINPKAREAYKKFEISFDTSILLPYCTQKQKEVLEMYNELSNLVKLKTIINSTITYKDIVEFRKSLVDALRDGDNRTPTPEQTVAITELAFHLFNPSSINIYLQGIAGTGKTTIVCKMIADFMRRINANTRISAMSIGELQNEKINKETIDAGRSEKIEWFDDDGIRPDMREELKAMLYRTDLLIFDEVGKFGNKQWSAFSQFISEIRKTNKKLKILFTGDPQQYSKSPFNEILDVRLQKETSLAWDMKVVTPMVLSQRSANGAINRIQLQFLTADRLDARDNEFNYQYSPSLDNGVHIVRTKEDLVAEIQRKVANPRANLNNLVVITTKEKIEWYKKNIPSVLAMTVQQSQGVDFNEIYIDLPYNMDLSGGFSNTNTLYYTALSRAKNYVCMLLPDVKGNTTADDISTSNESEIDRKERFNKNTELFKSTTNELYEKTKDLKTTNKVDVQTKEESKIVDDGRNNIDNEIKPETIIDNTKDEQVDSQKVPIGSPEAILYDEEKNKKTDKLYTKYETVKQLAKGDQLRVYARNKNGIVHLVYLANINGSWIEAAVSDAVGEFPNTIGYQTIYKEEDLNKDALIGTTEVVYASPLKYIWSDKKTNLGTGLNDVLNKVKDAFSKDNQKVEKLEHEIVLMDDKTMEEQKDFIPIGLNIKKNMPYIHVTVGLKGGKKNVHQYIEVEGKTLNINDKKYGTELPGNLGILHEFNKVRKYLDQTFKELGFSNIQFGKKDISTVTYGTGQDAKKYNITSHELFIRALKYKLNNDGKYESVSGYQIIKNLYDKINKLEGDLKDEVIGYIDAVREGIYTEEDSKVTDVTAVSQPFDVNKNVILTNTSDKEIGRKKLESLSKAKEGKVSIDPNILPLLDVGFTVVQTSLKTGEWVVRQTYEQTGKNPDGSVSYFHILVDYDLEVTNNRYELSNKAPNVEIFKIDAETYSNSENNNKNFRIRSTDKANRIYDSGSKPINSLTGWQAINNHTKLVEDINNLLTNGFYRKKTGTAQNAFNRIVQANGTLWLTPEENGKRGHRIHLRQEYKGKSKDGKKDVNHISAVSLESPNTMYVYEDKDGKESKIREGDIVEGDIAVEQFMTYDLDIVLDALTEVDNEGRSIANNGNGLYETIDKGLIQTAYRPTEEQKKASEQYDYKGKLLSILQTGFQGIQETMLTVGDIKKTSEVKSDVSINNEVSPLINELNNIDNISNVKERRDALMAFGKEHSITTESEIYDVYTEMVNKEVGSKENTKEELDKNDDKEQKEEGKEVNKKCNPKK